MNYQKIYNQIIEKRKLQEPQDCYTEVHHIVPRSLGGSDEPENLVRLTAREHFICHYLLAKMYEKESIEWYKMNHAFMMMKCQTVVNDRYFNSKLYESLRGNFSSIMSLATSGKGNSQYGTMWICNIEVQENRKIKKDDIIPEGWIKGRNKWNKIENLKKKEERLQNSIDNARFWYNKFINSGCKSVCQYIKLGEYPYHKTELLRVFRTYIPEYKHFRV